MDYNDALAPNGVGVVCPDITTIVEFSVDLSWHHGTTTLVDAHNELAPDPVIATAVSFATGTTLGTLAERATVEFSDTLAPAPVHTPSAVTYLGSPTVGTTFNLEPDSNNNHDIPSIVDLAPDPSNHFHTASQLGRVLISTHPEGCAFIPDFVTPAIFQNHHISCLLSNHHISYLLSACAWNPLPYVLTDPPSSRSSHSHNSLLGDLPSSMSSIPVTLCLVTFHLLLLHFTAGEGSDQVG